MRGRLLLVIVVLLVVGACLLVWLMGDASSPAPPRRPTAVAGETPDSSDAERAPRRHAQVPLAPSAEADAAEPLLRIRVTLPGGAPLGGVEVLATSAAVHWSVTPGVVATLTTDADGRTERALPPGDYTVRGVHAEYRILGAELSHPADSDLELAAAVGPELVILVHDADGEPVAGAKVWESHSWSGRVAVSDSDGRAELGRVFPRQPYVRVTAPGFVPWSNYAFGIWDGRDRYECLARLTRGTPITLRVLEHDGSIATDAVAYPGGVPVDAEGRARIDGHGEGSRTRVESPDGRTAYLAGAHITDGDTRDDETEIELTLPAPVSLTGLVRHAWTKEPVAGAGVWLDTEDDLRERAVSDAEGRFTIEGLVTRDGRMVAFKEGLGPHGEDWTEAVEQTADGEVVLEVAPTMTLTGRVVDSASRPVSGAEVAVGSNPDHIPLFALKPTVRTSADGRFVVAGVPPVEGLVVFVEHDVGHRKRLGWAGTEEEIPATPDASFDVGRIVLPDGFDLDVPVVDDEGAPLPSGIAWITWRIPTRGTPGVHRAIANGRMDPVPGIPRDHAGVTIHAPGCIDGRQRLDASTESIVVERPCTVSGRVVDDATGEPVAKVWVIVESKKRLYTMPGNHGGAETAADGTFTFGGVRRGPYRLLVRERKAKVTEVDIRARETSLGDVRVD